MLVILKKYIKIYVAKNGKNPFIEWLETLPEPIRYRVKERLDRVTLGNLGDHKFIGNSVYELRLDFGSGYRIYYINEGNNIILLLCGGNKSTQKQDIKKTAIYLKDYLSR